MKIAVISSTVFAVGTNGYQALSGYGGLEVIAWECARGLATKGHQVSLVAPDGSFCPGCNMIYMGPAGQIDEKMAWAGFPEGMENGVWKRRNHTGYWQQLLDKEVIIDHSWTKFCYMLKAEGALKAPVLGVLHAPVNTMYQSLPPVPKPCFVCISEDQRNHFEALFTPAKARVCHNGLDANYYAPLNLPRSDRYLFLARYSSIKSPDLAIQACLQAGVGLDLIGDTTITNEPEYFQHCMNLAGQTSINWDNSKGKQIRVMGGCSRSETVWWHSQAKSLIHFTPNFREPLGLSVLESQCCGTPVIACRYGSLPEVVKHGETGFLCESFEEVVQLLKADAVSLLDRGKCRQFASQYSLERMVNRYEELCKEAINTGGW